MRKNRRAGFTLIELTLAITLGAVVGTMLLALVNQQFSFLQIYRAQSFLIDEAPMVNMYASRIITRADRVTVHQLSGGVLGPWDAGGEEAGGEEAANAIRLYFRQPDGAWSSGVMAYDPGEGRLSFHVTNDLGSLVVGEPAWTVARLAPGGDVGFSLVQGGIIRLRLRGPLGEEISYDTYPSYSGPIRP